MKVYYFNDIHEAHKVGLIYTTYMFFSFSYDYKKLLKWHYNSGIGIKNLKRFVELFEIAE